MSRVSKAFTIVELLVTIIAIGIIASIATLSYNGVQNRAHDTNIQSDLNAIAGEVTRYFAKNGAYPAGSSELSTLGLRVTKNSYGNHYASGGTTYNLVYCRMPESAPTSFALAAFSRSGKVYMYTSEGSLEEYSGSPGGSATMCDAAGVDIDGYANQRDWFFDSGAWQSFAQG